MNVNTINKFILKYIFIFNAMAIQGSIRFLRDRLLGLNINNLATESVNNTSYKIIELNQSQIYSGQDADGDEISPGYKILEYALQKHAANPLPQFKKAPLGTPDLFLTGAFFSAFKVTQPTPGEALVDSSDAKASKLKQKYGPKIFGLSNDNLRIYVKEDFFPEFADGFTAATGLVFRWSLYELRGFAFVGMGWNQRNEGP